MTANEPAPAAAAPDLAVVLRSAGYLRLLLLAAVVGIPISAVGYGFVQLFEHLQTWLFTNLPHGLGFTTEPLWWPFPLLAIGGVIVGLTLRYLPGNGGHSPADGFSPAQPTIPALPGIVVAALASLAFGVVLGPEAPLIAIGGGMGIIAARLVLRHASPMAPTVVGVSGSFAALGTIFGNPLIAAFFMVEGIGLGGEMLTLVLLPGLISAGIGGLVFEGLGHWTGLGTSSLVLPDLPKFVRPTLAEIGWCVVIGLVAPLAAWGLRSGALVLRRRLKGLSLWGVIGAGLVVAGLAVAFQEASGKPSSSVLFSGQTLVGPIIYEHASWAVGALVLLLVFKGIAYAVSLSSFRGGPIFPAMLLGTAGGLLAAHLPGMGIVPGIAAGMGAMTVSLMRLPLASVLLPSLLVFSSGVGVIPVIIVAVVVAYVVSQHLPLPLDKEQPAAGAAGAAGAAPATAAGAAGAAGAAPTTAQPAPSPEPVG